jgi:hypothetical protein
MSRGSSMWAAGIVGLCILGGAGVAAAKEPDRVSGVSKAIDAAETGQDLGLPTVTGVGNSVIGTALASAPPEAAPVTDQLFPVLAVLPAVMEQLKAPSAEGYAALREALAPLAAANPQLNAALDAAGAAMTDATAVHPLIQPFDTTMIQVGQYLISLEEK